MGNFVQLLNDYEDSVLEGLVNHKAHYFRLGFAEWLDKKAAQLRLQADECPECRCIDGHLSGCSVGKLYFGTRR